MNSPTKIETCSALETLLSRLFNSDADTGAKFNSELVSGKGEYLAACNSAADGAVDLKEQVEVKKNIQALSEVSSEYSLLPYCRRASFSF